MPALTMDDAAHLLRRAGFGGTLAEITALAGQDRATVVDNILSATGPPDTFTPTGATEWDQWISLIQWWYQRMITSTAPLIEKMTLFWHGHFATAQNTIGNFTLMYQQNAMFRANALGNFRTLTHAVGRDPAMLFYLDNDPNVKGRQNENFARELWELFTLGVGNYTQDEVVASARSWTGHGVTPYPGPYLYQYTDSKHDHGMKTIFGRTADWDGDQVIDLSLRDDAAKQLTAAQFIARKLWTFFAYPNPPQAVVDTLANVFIATDWDITVALRTLLNLDEFYSQTAKQGLVRTPVEFMVAGMRYSGIGPVDAHPEWYADDMGQEIFNPPDVSGWKNNAYWISSGSFWARADFVRNLTSKANNADPLLNKLVDERADTVPIAVQKLFDHFAITNPAAATRSALEGWLTAERAAHGSAERANIFILTMLTPDFQLA
jgi:uncharacterized protein (DUF1800 family)